MKIKNVLEKITEINSQLLKNKLNPKDDLLVLEAQEIALELLYNPNFKN